MYFHSLRKAHLIGTLLSFAAIATCITSSYADLVYLKTSTNDLTFDIHDYGQFSVFLSKPVNYTVDVYFNYSEGRNIVDLPDHLVIKAGTTHVLTYNVTATKAGHTTVIAKTTAEDIDYTSAFVRVGVYKLYSLIVLSSVIGWLYFICWSVSFYPQIYDNFKRKSVIGLNFDFLGLNITGFLAYSVFNIGLRYSNVVKAEYHSLHPTGVIPVEVNDVVFAVHAVFATAVTIGQCFIYERGNQLISRTTVALLALAWSTAGVFLLVTSLGLTTNTPWLTFMYYFSYVKLAVTLTKYIPQVVYNYRRKSTVGWSIGTVLLDVVGGLFSILQMFLIAYNFDDFGSIFGNATKFGLGVASVFFDVVFMLQHYYFYRASRSRSRESLIPERP